MVRFGWGKRAKKKEETVADSNDATPSTELPRVSLSHVDTQLNMHHQANLFDSQETDQQAGTPPMELSSEPSTLPVSPNLSSISHGESSASEWSSAVGHATTGKSGRVIHNLQEEIARLTRECSLYRSRAEETQRSNEAYKIQLQNMTERLRNLEQVNETNLSSIARKDRKIEELRVEIQSEKDRRLESEQETRKIHQLMAEGRDEFNRKCAELQETTNHFRTQYDVLARAGQRERADFQKKFKGIQKDFLALKEHSEKKDLQLERLDAVMAQKNREIEVSRESFDKLFEEYKAYRDAQDRELRGLIERARQKESDLDAALASLKETEGKMKWTIQVKGEVKDSE
ncbi:hypothetical protein ASPZODRAFT_133108 [Penicilliopsis zonata CBS 506.65]|uniref:SWI5-dependent HO expression protein 3 n=1 Tax=Penicilliopsis zonata CBS 506.65 TaxID=1073090 RepID=A0A1L9SFQ6_9EURO|nr:hypothetical protein ASPZODRAFT_133108 [Penicilliopsis zonata CBS 506.65]OJJ46115.1 hypothetical protein ASPZODRAFT_133108 [Penicilliopsis zonata CBS 506.65]